ncbi:MAG: SPFH domain-containing protein [Phycisphaerae bacterium]
MTAEQQDEQRKVQSSTDPILEAEDEASRSLADALRVSFRLLSLVMLLVLAAWALTGLASVDSGENGIIYRFGRITRVAGEGLAYGWPFPIGRIEKVDMRERRVVVDDFWMDLTPEDQTKPLSEVSPYAEGLRPGRDGALLTGDRSLLHMKLGIAYRVEDPIAYKRNVPDPYVRTIAGTDESITVDPAAEFIRTAVCSAAIRAAAHRTADGLRRDEQEQFKTDVMLDAQNYLDELSTGLVITTVDLEGNEWPLRARPAYEDAQNASSEAEQLVRSAESEAQDILAGAAGANYVRLVGQPWRPGQPQAEEGDTEEFNLIGQYSSLIEAAREAGQAGDEDQQRQLLAQAEQVLERIDQVLLLNTTGGEASRIIAEARSYKTRVVESVKSRARQFAELRPEFERDPDTMMQYLWAETRGEILSRPGVEEYIIPSGERKAVLRISRPPEITRDIERQELRELQERVSD